VLAAARDPITAYATASLLLAGLLSSSRSAPTVNAFAVLAGA
jgi:hypothetical protein